MGPPSCNIVISRIFITSTDPFVVCPDIYYVCYKTRTYKTIDAEVRLNYIELLKDGQTGCIITSLDMNKYIIRNNGQVSRYSMIQYYGSKAGGHITWKAMVPHVRNMVS